jgi:hypothetical protein
VVDATDVPEAIDTPGVPVEAASILQKQEALKQYRLGVDLMNEKRYAEALDVLLGSYRKVNSPNSRLMVARVLARLERYPEAYVELSGVIADASKLAASLSKYEKTIEAAKLELDEVSSKVALLKLNVDGRLRLAGAEVEPSRWNEAIPLKAGPVQLVYELQNGQRVEVSAELKPGETTQVDLAFPEPSPPVAPQAYVVEKRSEAPGVSYSTLAWVGAGVGVLGLSSLTVFGLMTESQFKALSKECPAGNCPASRRADAESGRTFQTLANVGLGVGLAGALGATYFWVFAPEEADPELSLLSQRANGGPIQTQVRVGLAAISVAGSF